MSLVGKLDELPLSDLLQIIGTNRKNGRLSLTRHDAQGIIVFRDGKIIYAATTSARETLGHLLLSEGLIDDAQLAQALENQHNSSEEKRLGTVLLQAGFLSRDDLTRVIQEQTGKVIAEFLSWSNGFFKFDKIDLEDHGEIGVDVVDFRLERGLTPDSVLLDFSERLDELKEPVSPPDPTRAPADTMTIASLKTLMSEIRSPEFTGEIGQRILGFASGVFPRAILFFLRRGTFVGMGGHSRIKIPLDVPSILSEAAGRKSTARGPLDHSEWNLSLISQLGGETPTEAAAMPLVVNQKVLLVLYGDNAGSDRPLAAHDEIELLVLQAGLAMEKNLLEKRIEQFEKLRGVDAAL